MADPQGLRQLPAVGIEVTVDLQGRQEPQEVRVPTPSGEEVLVDPREHREDVVRRLLELGVTTRCLKALLPTWTLLISRVAKAMTAEDVRSVTTRGGRTS